MKLIFAIRDSFEAALNLIFDNPNIRGSSDGSMNIHYADMIVEFGDKNHGQRAIDYLKKNKISNFEVEPPTR
jgi:hypothetical protein